MKREYVILHDLTVVLQKQEEINYKKYFKRQYLQSTAPASP